MTALRTICDSTNEKAKAKLLSVLTKDHFYYEPAKVAFDRVLRLLRRNSEVPDWTDLTTDAVLAEPIRSELEGYTSITVSSSSQRIKRLYTQLDDYRKMRILFFESEKVLQALDKDSVDVNKLLTSMADQLVKAQAAEITEDDIVTIGHNSTSSKSFEELISKPASEVVRTGFSAWDDRNGGLFNGGLVVIAATSGGGKSAMINQLCINMSKNGRKVCLVPLEMTKREMLARVAANVTGMNVKKFLIDKLTSREERVARKKWSEFEEEAAKLEGSFRIFEPPTDVSMEEVLTLLKPYNDDVIAIDYIGLLKGTDGDDSWRELGKAARFSKVWAKNNNKIVILLAQLSDEGQIRYSRSIKEHANVMWTWTYGDENRETGVIDVVPQKARNQEMLEFQLGHDFATMRMFDISQETEPSSRRSSNGRAKHKRLREATSDIDKYLEDRNG